MITIVEQTTAERKNETKDLFEQIKPYLDEGFSYKSALVKIGRISRGTNLNIRKGPGTDCAKTGRFTGVGIFTIIEEAEGRGATRWGRLKSRAGWISLDYVTRI